jgi:hypothetical protein
MGCFLHREAFSLLGVMPSKTTIPSCHGVSCLVYLVVVGADELMRAREQVSNRSETKKR